MLKFLIVAVIIVGIQLVVIPTLNIIVGQEAQLPALVLFFTYLALTIGELNVFRISFFGKALAICGLSVLSLGVLYHVDSIALVQMQSLQIILFVALFLLMILIGRVLLYVLYFENPFSDNYFKINILSMIITISWVALMPQIGLSISLILISVLSIALIKTIPKKAEQYVLKRFEGPVCTREDIWTMLLGVVTGGIIAVYFEIIVNNVYPTGFEFPTYLITVFLFFAITSRYVKGVSKLFNPFEGVSIALFTLSAIILSLFVEVGGQPLIYLGDIAFFVREFQLPHHTYMLMMTVIFLLPYIFVAPLIPLRDRQNPDRNHFFYCSLGNLIGLAVFSLMIPDVSLHVKFIILCGIAVLWVVRVRHVFKVVPIVLVAMYTALPNNIEEVMVKQAFGPYEFVWADPQADIKPPRYQNFDVVGMVKSNGTVGAKTNWVNTPKYHLSLGAYTTSLTTGNGPGEKDIKAGFAASALYKPGMKILVLGLGNHFVLNALDTVSWKSDNSRIDVIDNFSGFKDLEFRQAIAGTNGFDWDKTSVNFIYGDALNYLATTSEKYDMVAWNLTFLNYSSGRKLFTKDFFSLVHDALTDKGIFLGNFHHNPVLDCTSTEPFDEVKHIGSTSYKAYPYNITLFVGTKNGPTPSWLNAAQFDKEKYCRGVQRNTLANPFKFYNPDRWFFDREPFVNFDKISVQADYDKGKLQHSRIYLTMPTSDSEDKRKWLHMRNAIDAFLKLYRTYKFIHLYDTGAKLSDKLNGTREMYEGNWLPPSPLSICFGAPDSITQRALLDNYNSREMMEKRICSRPIVSQVTVLKERNEFEPTLSTFYGPEGYSQELFPAILKMNGRIDNVYISDSGSYDYFKDIAAAMKAEARKFVKGVVKDVSLNELINKITLTEHDVIIFNDYINHSHLAKEVDTKIPLKVFPYGDLEYAPRFMRNSIQTIFWHPDYNYRGVSEIDSCQFSKFYQEEFGIVPDFHAAFMFAIFQVLEQFDFNGAELSGIFRNRGTQANTVVGTVKWDEKGRPILHSPMYFYVGHDGEVSLLNAEEEGFTKCGAK
jgi:hypothetical protein